MKISKSRMILFLGIFAITTIGNGCDQEEKKKTKSAATGQQQSQNTVQQNQPSGQTIGQINNQAVAHTVSCYFADHKECFEYYNVDAKQLEQTSCSNGNVQIQACPTQNIVHTCEVTVQYNGQTENFKVLAYQGTQSTTQSWQQYCQELQSGQQN